VAASPLPPVHLVVPPQWCDYNAHFSDGYYLVAFSNAAETALEAVGLGAAYRAQGDYSAYTVEAQVRYLREAKAGDALVIRHAVEAVDDKRLRLHHEMHRGSTLLATCRFVYVHVDTRGPRSAPFPAAIRARIAAVSAAGDTSLPAAGAPR
jgi:acyl-CoA thioesterase FadM